MARDPRVPSETEIPWWGYLVVALAIVTVIIVGVFVWHLIALLAVPLG
jgi:purine-cytosine permease-like protein